MAISKLLTVPWASVGSYGRVPAASIGKIGGSAAPAGGGITYETIPGLKGLWKLNESSGTEAFDSSPNGFTGALTGTVSWDTGALGGPAALFGGGRIAVPHNATLDAAFTKGFMGMWVNVTSDVAAIMLTKRDTWGTVGMGLVNKIWASSVNAVVDAGPVTVLDAAKPSGWFFVACRCDGTTYDMFLNGVKQAGGASFSGSVSNTADFVIADFSTAVAYPLLGSANYAFYSTGADVSDQDVLDLYNLRKSIYGH